jgi:hypothetical protein
MTALTAALAALAVFGPAHIIILLYFGAIMWKNENTVLAFLVNCYAMYCTVYFAHIFMDGLAFRKTDSTASKQNS